MCNAWNHSPGCTCGWGGDGHVGHSYGGNYYTHDSSSVMRVTSWHEASGTYDSYINRNAHCPVCGDNVIFYQSPFGGRVFFDSLGWPWPKHPCTDRSISNNYIRKDIEETPKALDVWQVQGWKPFVCLYQNKPIGKQVEIFGKILTKNPTSTFFIIAYTKPLDFNLKAAPIFIKELNKDLGTYKLSTFKESLSESSLEVDITPLEVQLFSAKPLPTYRGRPICPKCGCEAIDLSNHMNRFHITSKIRPPNQPIGKIKTKPKTNRHFISLQKSKTGERVKCPRCNASVRASNLNKHLRKVHHSE